MDHGLKVFVRDVVGQHWTVIWRVGGWVVSLFHCFSSISLLELLGTHGMRFGWLRELVWPLGRKLWSGQIALG